MPNGVWKCNMKTWKEKIFIGLNFVASLVVIFVFLLWASVLVQLQNYVLNLAIEGVLLSLSIWWLLDYIRDPNVGRLSNIFFILLLWSLILALTLFIYNIWKNGIEV